MTTVRKIIEVLERETEENTIPWRPDHKEQNWYVYLENSKISLSREGTLRFDSEDTSIILLEKGRANPLCQMLYDRIPLRKPQTTDEAAREALRRLNKYILDREAEKDAGPRGADLPA